jgi:hypothetical protein
MCDRDEVIEALECRVRSLERNFDLMLDSHETALCWDDQVYRMLEFLEKVAGGIMPRPASVSYQIQTGVECGIDAVDDQIIYRVTVRRGGRWTGEQTFIYSDDPMFVCDADLEYRFNHLYRLALLEIGDKKEEG